YRIAVEEIALKQLAALKRKTPALPMTSCAKRARLHNPVAKERVFSGQQLLGELITAPVHIARGAREVMVDPHASRAAEIRRVPNVSINSESACSRMEPPGRERHRWA